MTQPEPLQLPLPRPRLRFWHILLAGTGCLVLLLIAVGAWHGWRVRRQAALVQEIESVGGTVSYYHHVVRLPDGGFEYGEAPSPFSEEFRKEYPNFCSRVFGVHGGHYYPDRTGLTPVETEQFFQAARGLPGLRSFSLASSSFPGHRLAELPSLRQLQDLCLYSDQLTDADVLILAQAAELRDLVLDSTQLTDVALPRLAALKNLKRLMLCSPRISDAGLSRLKVPANLEFLSLNLPAVTDQGLCSLQAFPELRELQLEMPVGDAGIIHLTAGGQLYHINMTQCRFGDAGLAAIAKNPGMWGHLDLAGSAVTDEGLRHLAALPQITGLTLAETKITDAGLAHLAGVPKLRALLLAKTAVTGKGLLQLTALDLDDIDLTDCQVGEEGLRALAAFEALNELNLAGTPINDESCCLIPKPAGGSLLDLSRTKLTDACIARLMPTTFGEVNLDGTALTDAGLLAIATDEGQLGTLSVRNTKVTAKGVLDFENRMWERGHTCELIHDIPSEDLEALHDARRLEERARLLSRESQANPS